MSIESMEPTELMEAHLKRELHQEAAQMQVPAELAARVRNSFWKFQQEQRTTGGTRRTQGSRLKSKPLLAAALAGLIVLPTGAFAYGAMTDDLYGSFASFKKEVSIATKDMYMDFAMKLSGAKVKLGAQDYAAFLELLRAHNVYVVEYGDKYGHVNYDAMPAKTRASAKAVNIALQPYFDRLNGQKQSKVVLTPAEFDQYMEADMTYVSILAETGQDDSKPVEAKDLPPQYQERFAQAQEVLQKVNQKLSVRGETPWEAKAHAALGDAEYAKFQDELVQMNDLRERYGSHEGNLPMLIDFDSVPSAVRTQAKALIEQDTDYRDRIANEKPAREVLTSAAYEAYIQAIMDRETVCAKTHQAEVNGHTVDVDALPSGLRERYVHAKHVMDDVAEKQKAQ